MVKTLVIWLALCGTALADIALSGNEVRALEKLFDPVTQQIVVLDMKCANLPPLSPSGRTKIACDKNTNKIMVSTNGTSYSVLGSASAAGANHAVQMGDGTGNLADTGCTADGAGGITCTSYSSTCSGNNCGWQFTEANTDCLTNGSPGAGKDNFCFISGKPKYRSVSGLYSFGGMIPIFARTSAGAQLLNSTTETDQSSTTLANTPVANRTWKISAGGTMQLVGTNQFDYKIRMGPSATTQVLADFATTTAIGGATPYKVDVTCVSPTSGGSGVVSCAGDMLINGLTPIATAAGPVTVDLTGNPTLKTTAKFGTPSNSNNLTENLALFQEGDPDAATGTTTSTSVTSTSTSTISTTSTTIAGGSNPPDWTNATHIVGMWDFEATDGTASRCSTGGTNCDLTTVGTPTASTGTRGVDFTYGSKAVGFASTAALTRTNNTTTGISGTTTIAAWMKFPTLPTNNAAILASNSSTTDNGIRLSFPNFNFNVQAMDVGQGGGHVDSANVAVSPTAGVWRFFYGVSGITTNTAANGYFQGASTVNEQTFAQTTGAMVNSTSTGKFGFNDVNFLPAACASPPCVIMDEGIFSDVALTQMSLCRICSCGLDGLHPPDTSPACTCSGSTWNTKGANATMCGGCTLNGATEACNAAAPASR